MKFRLGAAWVALALAAAGPSVAWGQSTDAFVLPWGMVRLSVEGTHETFESRFEAGGDRVPLAQGLAGDLTPARFAALRPLSLQLERFFTQTAGGPGASPDPPDAAAITLGTLDARAAAAQTHAPLQLAIGLIPRLEIGASILLNRGERFLQRLDLAGGSVGIDPDPTSNLAILGSIGWEELGSLGLLPTAGSAAGIELQSRVTALAGNELTLPAAAADSAALQALLADEFALAPLASRVDPLRLGNAEVYARALLLSTFGMAPLPTDSGGFHFRVSVSGGVRIPTGTEPDSFPLLAPPPAERLSGYHAGMAGDLFLGPRLWIGGSTRLTWNTSSRITRRIAPMAAPLSVDAPPQSVTIDPGDALEIAITPRFRLVESISLGADYSVILVGDTRYSGGTDGTDAALLDLAGGGLHRVGLAIRYSSLPAYWDRRAALPARVELTYRRTIVGPEGAPAGGAMTVMVSLLPQLWGRE